MLAKVTKKRKAKSLKHKAKSTVNRHPSKGYGKFFKTHLMTTAQVLF